MTGEPLTTDRAARMRAALVRMVVGVLLVDALGLVVFLFTPLAHSSNGRYTVGVVWLLATLAVVLPGLQAIRVARRR
ncbi:MAG: hypothetical protein V4503_07260 [Gemmatimonadota bacterium]